MEIKLNGYVINLKKINDIFLYTSPVYTISYTISMLEITNNIIFEYDNRKISFESFIEIELFNIDNNIMNITSKSYQHENIIISTRINWNNNEEITFILIK